MSPKIEDLLPDLQNWNNGEGIDINGFLSCVGNYELAIAFANYFWPAFFEHDGCIFRGNQYDNKCGQWTGNYEQWKIATKNDKTAVEGLMNHVHILDLFPNVEQTPTRDQIIYIGRQLQQMWAAKVRTDFPHLDVVVEFDDDCGDDLLEYQITLFQNRLATDQLREDAG